MTTHGNGKTKLTAKQGLRFSAQLWNGVLQYTLGSVPLIIVLVLFTALVTAAPLKLEVGKTVYISDRPDSLLLRQAHSVVLQEQVKLQKTFGLTITDSVKIYFYYDRDDASPSIHAAPYWSGGIARSGSEIHIFSPIRRDWLTTLKHELFHILVYQNEVDIPVWLNEGLAQWQSGDSDWGHFTELAGATARGSLIPLVDLDVILTFHHKKASLAYGQSLDAVRFLVQRYGGSVLPYLLRADNLTFRERFKQETGESLVDFEIAWRESLERRFWFFKISQIPAVFWALSPFIVMLAWFLKHRRGKQRIREWEAEETDQPPF